MKAKMMAGGGKMKKGYAAGGVMDDENEMMGKMGRGMTKATMQKKAMKAGGATKKMMAGGGMTKKMQAGGGVTRADGIVKKGHTRGKIV